MLFFDVEAWECLEEWAFGEFGVGSVFGFSAVWVGVGVLGIEFPFDWAFVDGGGVVGHEEVAFKELIVGVFHMIRV